MHNDAGARSLGDEMSACRDNPGPPLYRGRVKGCGQRRGVRI